MSESQLKYVHMYCICIYTNKIYMFKQNIEVKYCCKSDLFCFWIFIKGFMTSKIERKAMIRNRYNYLTPSIQDTKGEKDAPKATNHYQNTSSRKLKGQFLSQTNGQTAIQNKNFTRTHIQRHTITEIVNHSRSVALERSVKTLWGRNRGGRGGGLHCKPNLRGLNPRL